MKKRLLNITDDPIINGGIFKALDTFNPPWKSSVSYTALDMEYYYNVSGKKKISSLTDKILGNNTALTNANLSSLASVIYAINATNWAKEWATMSFIYDPISNYDMTESETTTRESSDEKHNTGTQTDQGSTSNTGTQTNAGSVTHTGTQGNAGTVTNTGTQTDQGSTSNTGTQTNAGTTAHTGTQATVTDQDIHAVNSGGSDNYIYGFNSVNYVGDTGGTTSGINDTANDETATRTDNLLQTDSYTRTDNLAGTNSNTRTDNLTETTSNTRTDNLTDTDTHTRTDNLAGTTSNTRTDNLTETVDGESEENRTLTRSGNIGVTTSQQMIQSERDLYMWNFFYNIVFPSVDKILTLSTY